MKKDKTIPVELAELSDCIVLPEIDDLPPEQTHEERIRDQKQERLDEINAQHWQFVGNSQIPVDIFMERKVSTIEENPVSCSLLKTSFREDVESYEQSETDQISAFQRLYLPRTSVCRTREFRESFKKNSLRLEMFMDDKDIARFPNALKRIKRGESVKSCLPRYSAEQIKQRMGDKSIKDLFGLGALLPLSLTKSNKNSYERKVDTFYKFHDVMYDFDYSNREEFEEMKEVTELQKELAELDAIIDSLKLKPRFDSGPFRKRRHDEEKSGKESRESAPGTFQQIQQIVRNVDPSVERERLLREQRRLATLKRDAEYMEAQKKAAEEREKQQAAERAEMELANEAMLREVAALLKEKREKEEKEKEAAEKRRKELERNLERSEGAEKENGVDGERELEELKRVEEKNKLEEQKRLEESRRQKEEDEEAERQRASQIQKENSSTSEFVNWKIFAFRKPSNWSQRKEQFFNHFHWPTDQAQRELEKTYFLKTHSQLTTIPHENHAYTKVTPLRLPKISVPSTFSSTTVAIKNPDPAPPVAVNRVADDGTIEELVREIKNMMAVSQRSIAYHVSLSMKQVDYREINLLKLKRAFTYPFYLSDGMYWPVLYCLEEQTNPCHVQSLAVCNSFSGKYASRHLLTRPLENDTVSKKFEATYNDCGGSWNEYSQKPGRFSNRKGYQAHKSTSKHSMEVQRKIGRDSQHNRHFEELREGERFGRYMSEFNRCGGDRRQNKEYNKHIKLHLRELVKDARLDAYSMKEEYSNRRLYHMNHPGTRESPLPFRWQNHGYKIYQRTRDFEFGRFMHEVCAPYEDLLERRRSRWNCEQFNRWCFTPMLASLYYQIHYSPYDVMSSEETKELKERYKKYYELLNEKKFPMEKAIELCRLTPVDKKQWTILHDQLVSLFRDYPTISQIMYNPEGKMIKKVDIILNNLMRKEFKDRSNGWFFGL